MSAVVLLTGQVVAAAVPADTWRLPGLWSLKIEVADLAEPGAQPEWATVYAREWVIRGLQMGDCVEVAGQLQLARWSRSRRNLRTQLLVIAGDVRMSEGPRRTERTERRHRVGQRLRDKQAEQARQRIEVSV